jgi:vitamin B12 transporter
MFHPNCTVPFSKYKASSLNKYFGLVLCVFLFSLWLPAQTDSLRALQLQEVQIQAVSQFRLKAAGQAVYQADTVLQSLQSNLRISDVLRLQGLANVRSYGAALTSTIGLRGGSANQTAIVWNGFRLPTPLSGLSDASLLPATFFDEIRVVPGGQGALWGSSAVGGVLALTSRSQVNGISVDVHSGSFGQYGGNAGAHYTYGRWQAGLRASARAGAFDYAYTVPGTDVERKLVHASAQFAEFMPQLSYQASKKWKLEYAGWFNSAERQIPPLVTQTTSEAVQRDRGNRHTVQAHYTAEKLRIDLRAGHFGEQIQYDDSLSRVFSLVKFATTTTEAESRYYLSKRQTIHVGMQYAQNQGDAPGYSNVVQHRANAFGSYAWSVGKLLLQADLRMANKLIPAAAVEYKPSEKLRLRSRAGTTWRQPVFNELYWQPGGNPNLKDETGWNTEVGADAYFGAFTGSGTAYWRSTRNQILWAPSTGSIFWSPDNLGLVETRGLELRAKWYQRISKRMAGTVHLSYDLADARNRQAVKIPAIAEGDALWFVPRHQTTWRAQVQGTRWLIYATGHYTTSVPTPEGRLEQVHLYGSGLSRDVKWKQNRFTVYARVDNLTNQTWISIDRRPMPGRAWVVGLSLALNARI